MVVHVGIAKSRLQQTLLVARGFEVAQPTLSRDMKELGLAKTPAGYVDPSGSGANAFVAQETREERLARVLRQWLFQRRRSKNRKR